MSEAHKAPSTDLLYHYTDQYGLVGIIERRELWASNLGCLNDISEFKHGLDLLRSSGRQIIEEILADRPPDEPETQSAERVFKYLIDEAERRYLSRDPAEYLFVFSLFGSNRRFVPGGLESDPGDNLQQWRAYNKGGFGYCIGFDKKLLELKVKELDDAKSGIFCGGCIYDDVEKYEIAKRITGVLIPACNLGVSFGYPETPAGRLALARAVESFGDELSKLRETRESIPLEKSEGGQSLSRSEARELLAGALAAYFGRVLIESALMKHGAFAEEREWRVVRLAFALSQELKFRTSVAGVVPYAAVSIAESGNPARVVPGLIKRIVVGPMGNASMDARMRAISIVRMLLENNGIEVARTPGEAGVVVEGSNLPC